MMDCGIQIHWTRFTDPEVMAFHLAVIQSIDRLLRLYHFRKFSESKTALLSGIDVAKDLNRPHTKPLFLQPSL